MKSFFYSSNGNGSNFRQKTTEWLFLILLSKSNNDVEEAHICNHYLFVYTQSHPTAATTNKPKVFAYFSHSLCGFLLHRNVFLIISCSSWRSSPQIWVSSTHCNFIFRPDRSLSCVYGSSSGSQRSRLSLPSHYFHYKKVYNSHHIHYMWKKNEYVRIALVAKKSLSRWHPHIELVYVANFKSIKFKGSSIQFAN